MKKRKVKQEESEMYSLGRKVIFARPTKRESIRCLKDFCKLSFPILNFFEFMIKIPQISKHFFRNTRKERGGKYPFIGGREKKSNPEIT